MSTHTPEHEALVDRILGGELAEDDARARAQLAACPECRAQLARLRALDAGLSAAARQAREDVEAARAEPDPGEEALVRDSMLAALPKADARPKVERNARPAPRRWLAVALAAGLLLALGASLYYLSRSRSPAEPEILLHGGTVVCDRPVGAVADYDEFAWRAALPPGGRFELTIHALEQDKAGALVKTIAVQEPRWIPSAEEKRALPDEIWWEVRALDVSEESVAQGWAIASRSR